MAAGGGVAATVAAAASEANPVPKLFDKLQLLI